MIADSAVAYRSARSPLFLALRRRRHLVELAATPQAAGSGRRLVRELTESWRLPLDSARAHEVALLTSELLTNAVIHGGGRVTLGVRMRGNRLRVEVGDEDPRPPVLAEPTERCTHGRGLLLVDQLAADWGWRLTRGGKRVWFEVRP
jgi:anti-sigma regulatory factor (Ser/Thr protein kinase)